MASRYSRGGGGRRDYEDSYNDRGSETGGNWRDNRGGGGRGGGRGRWHGNRGGRRDWRGKRGCGRGRYFDGQDGAADDYDGGQHFERRGQGRRGGGGPPPGISGRDIGLWYAARSKKKTMDMELQSRTFIKIDENKERHLQGLLNTIRGTDQLAPQPSRSYRDLSDEEEPRNDQKHSQECVPDDWFAQPDGAVAENCDQATASVNQSYEFSQPSCSGVANQPNKQDSASLRSSAHSSASLQSLDDEEWSDGETGMGDAELLNAAEDAEERLRAEMEESQDEEDEDALNINEVFRYKENCDFIIEFLSHNQENRRSTDRLDDVSQNVHLVKIPELDWQLKLEMEDKVHDKKYQQMQKFRKKLPSYKMQKELVDLTAKNQVVVISGETGCGKTTQVAQFILDDYIARGDGSLCRIVCTQPRRISAISVAERVAQERGETCGSGSVGYHIRLESKMPRQQGSVLFCTTGILLKSLTSDPWLSRTSHVILDEIHERDLQSDFLLIILRDLIQQRKDLKIILMSATLNAEKFSEYYGNCPMTNIPGFTYPVQDFLLEDVLEITGYVPNDVRQPRKRRGQDRRQFLEEKAKFEHWISRLPGKKYSLQTREVLKQLNMEEIDLDLILCLIKHIVHNKSEGAILVFLPGWDQISKLHKLLQSQTMFNSSNFRIIPLHSLMPTINQKQVFERPPQGVRKIVIATNIAETSITIEDVVYVIDCGKIKLKNFDPENKVATLKPEPVSKANARQRRGRAGRVQPGECFHLYTAWHERQFADYQLPEMLRTTLEELCLQIKMLKLGMIIPFVSKAMQPPSLEALRYSIQALRDLCALDGNEDLTPLGYHLAKMPVDPHTGKMLLFAAMFCCLDPILTIAASLSFKDAFIIPIGKERLADQARMKLSQNTKSDHIMLAKAFEGWERAKKRGTANDYCWQNFLSPNTLKLLSDMRRQFTELLFDMKFLSSRDPHNRDANINSDNLKLVKAVVCAGLYPNVAKMKPRKAMSRRPPLLYSNLQKRIQFHPKSVNADAQDFDQQWFIYHLLMKVSSVYIYDSTMIPPYPLLFFGGVIDIRKDHGQDCIVVDEWIVFRSSRRIAHLVRELRVELDRLLEYKITHPGVTNWNPKEKEGALMRAITDLITTEEHKSKNTY